MTQPSTQANTLARTWSVAAFERFWSSPQRDPAVVPEILTEDVVGHWSGLQQPVRGREQYMRCIEALLAALPDMYLTVAAHAACGDLVFIHWIMHGSAARGRFELTGIDRIRTRDGRLCENLVVFDTAAFTARTGLAVPWVQSS